MFNVVTCRGWTTEYNIFNHENCHGTEDFNLVSLVYAAEATDIHYFITVIIIYLNFINH